MSERPDFSHVPVEIQERLAQRDAQYEAAYARGAAAERLQTALQAAGGSASSPRGEVKATVSAAGLLTDLQISQRGLDLGAAGLSRLIKATVRGALLDLAERLADAVEESDAGQVGAGVLAEARAGLAGPLGALATPGEELSD